MNVLGNQNIFVRMKICNLERKNPLKRALKKIGIIYFLESVVSVVFADVIAAVTNYRNKLCATICASCLTEVFFASLRGLEAYA